MRGGSNTSCQALLRDLALSERTITNQYRNIAILVFENRTVSETIKANRAKWFGGAVTL